MYRSASANRWSSCYHWMLTQTDAVMVDMRDWCGNRVYESEN